MVFTWRPAITGPDIATERSASWQERAACLNVDPTIFHPVGDTWPEGGELAAKDICSACPLDVREKCLDLAVAADDRWGVFGGLTADERRGRGARGQLPKPPVLDSSRYLKCPSDHPLNDDNLGHDSKGRRYCLECERIRARAYDAVKRENKARVSA